MKKLEFTTSICLKLLETCLKRLTFRDHLETICMLIRLLFTSIQRQRHHMASMGGDNGGEIKEDEVFNKLLRVVRDHLISDLPSTMSSYYRSNILQKELEVCQSEILLLHLQLPPLALATAFIVCSSDRTYYRTR